MPWHDPPLRAAGMEVLADGVHEGVRWWLQRVDEAPHLLVTLSGLDGGFYVVRQAELTEARPGHFAGWLGRTVERHCLFRPSS